MVVDAALDRGAPGRELRPDHAFDARLHLMPAGCVDHVSERAASIGPAHTRDDRLSQPCPRGQTCGSSTAPSQPPEPRPVPARRRRPARARRAGRRGDHVARGLRQPLLAGCPGWPAITAPPGAPAGSATPWHAEPTSGTSPRRGAGPVRPAGREVYFGRTQRAGADGSYNVAMACPRDEPADSPIPRAPPGPRHPPGRPHPRRPNPPGSTPRSRRSRSRWRNPAWA